MLKIPTSTDSPPPLLAPLRRTSPEQPAAENQERHGVKKRRKSKKSAASHSWENDPTKSRRGEGIRMRWFLIGGASLLAISITGVMVAMHNHSNDPEGLGRVGGPVGHLGAKPKGLSHPEVASRSETEFLADSEALALKFLNATAVDQLLPLVRNPELVEPKMRKFYQEGNLKAEGISQFNTKEFPPSLNGFRSVSIVTGDFEQKSMVFTDTVGEMKVDWESWVGWSEMSWKEFVTAKPLEAKTFRVILSTVNYYNFDFKDEDRWQSYRLEFPDHEHSIYGYVERFSDLAKAIASNEDEKETALMLSLKFLPNESTDQVVIERLVNTGWLEHEEKK